MTVGVYPKYLSDWGPSGTNFGNRSADPIPEGDGWTHHRNVIEWRPKKPEPVSDLCPHCGQSYDYAAWLLASGTGEAEKPEQNGLNLDDLDKSELLEIARQAGVEVD